MKLLLLILALFLVGCVELKVDESLDFYDFFNEGYLSQGQTSEVSRLQQKMIQIANDMPREYLTCNDDIDCVLDVLQVISINVEGEMFNEENMEFEREQLYSLQQKIGSSCANSKCYYEKGFPELEYFGVINPQKFVPERCTTPSGFSCYDFKADVKGVKISLTNNLGENIEQINVKISKCNQAIGPKKLMNREKGIYEARCDLEKGKMFESDIEITYKKDFVHTSTGRINAEVQH